ncbi:MAG: DNA repair protein RecO [Proteobacteria bacterium]|nr:DNA repair protein RecO [Pseudomonadota bacterium]MBU1387021.1 DNA repair protein RecO [Pseudomonadota bacterium]MBU1542298.1 DNA repair protein RecO [Pseudomonadota bacterium]MBU2429363.1 DNA repair protein RecO [Pseudomonadota bacterium]MBU2479595.1 DNA repair protein RecO [Pseudomonadota bacterium]
MSGFSTDAILLRKIEYGDHDFIISFLSRDRGKVSVIAKNAKQSVKRFSGALDLFSLNSIQCTFPKKKKDALTILSRTDLENGFANIRCDVFKTTYASFWAELIHFWLEEGKVVNEVYDLLKFSLEALDTDSMEKQVLNLLFGIRFISLSGFSPNIEQCDQCQTPIDQIQQKYIRFDFKAGRITCKNCEDSHSNYSMTVSKGTLKQLFWINNNDFKRADRIRFSPFAIKEGQMLLEAFIPFHLGRDFNSLKFLNRLRQETCI